VTSKELRQPIALFSGPVNAAYTQQLLIARPVKKKIGKKAEERGEICFLLYGHVGGLSPLPLSPVLWADF